MIIEVETDIHGSREAIWNQITDIENATKAVSGIEHIEILEKPESGLVGLKWRETRMLFGKTATEVMWITEATPHEGYRTRAENHGSVYTTTLTITGEGENHSLRMTFEAVPKSLFAKLLSTPMGLAFKGPTQKALLQDLNDIKHAVEGH